MRSFISSGVILGLALIAGCGSMAKDEDPATWTDAQADEWFSSRDWVATTSMQPDPSINRREFAKQYHQHKDWWDSAFAFMKNDAFSTLPAGNIHLDGDDVFVKVSEYNTKNPEDAFYEVHREYADIHFVVSGEEYIGQSDVSEGKLRTPYDKQKDIVFYEGVAGKEMLARPGTFYIFFPGEGHRPGVRNGQRAWVKKIVIKVRTGD